MVLWNFDSEQFEKSYTYEPDDLGFTYTKTTTIWKLWAPTACAVSVKLYMTGSDQEEGSCLLGTYPMHWKEKGVWELILKGDYDGVYYTYLVEHTGWSVETADPYSQAAGVNGERSMVLDFRRTDPEGWEDDRRIHTEAPTKAVIWETHVRDFSEDPHSGMVNKGKYLAFTERDTHLDGHPEIKTGVSYLKELGITHVQLMPVADFVTVDESKPGVNQYNWGYDPGLYSVPEGSYASDPYHGEIRIREFKQLVQALHSQGIGVIMDVVYNHTYYTEQSVLHRTVPNYYHRKKEDGTFSNGSGCGNEIASQRSMCRKLILNSIRHWVEEYHVDGFRFDLMGVMDLETVRRIRKMLDAMPDGKSILTHGEPWIAAPLAIPQQEAAGKHNARKLPLNVAIFNDDTRDSIKGNTFDAKHVGFVNGDLTMTWKVQQSVIAWSGPQRTVRVPTQTITYCSAHDNLTLWDKLVSSMEPKNQNYQDPLPNRINADKMAAFLVLTSQGIPFIQEGDEFGRSKKGDDNSYRSPIQVNRIDWGRRVAYDGLYRYYRDLIDLRKKHPVFSDPTERTARNCYFSFTTSGVIAYTLPVSEGERLAVVVNATDREQEVRLEVWTREICPKQWQVIFDDQGYTKKETALIVPEVLKVPSRMTWVLKALPSGEHQED